MKNRTLAEQFADGATKGKTGSMFIEGDAIYSYGYHFVIARRTVNGFQITARKYSPTTSRHTSETLRALTATGKTVEHIDELK